MLFELACLFYEARNNKLDIDGQMDACSEVGRLAWAAGFNVNDLAKMLLGKQDVE
jgi:hypothetical protein